MVNEEIINPKNKTDLSMNKPVVDKEEINISDQKFSERDHDRIIEMAWEDRTPFEAIEFQFKLTEKQVIDFMRNNLKLNSFKRWRKRVTARKTKHSKLRLTDVIRFKCSRQKHTGNKV